jgi:sugar phosphate isomerase/epimerase
MHSRRNFMKTLAATAAAFGVSNAIGLEKKKKLLKGILLGTLQKQMTDNPQETLKYLAELGYQTLEYPGTFGHDAKLLRQMIKEHHLISLAGGDAMAAIKKNFAAIVTEYQEMGKEYLICYWPWMDNGKNKTLNDWKRNADVFNVLGKACKKEGLRLAYHNHEIEFNVTEDIIPYDILLKNTDPEYLTFQIDLWWVVKGNRNPAEYLKNYSGRFELCHIKTADVFASTEVAVDYTALLPLAENAGCKHFIIENELVIEHPLDYAKNSIQYLNNILK